MLVSRVTSGLSQSTYSSILRTASLDMFTIAVGCVVWWVERTYSRDYDGLLMQVDCDTAGRSL